MSPLKWQDFEDLVGTTLDDRIASDVDRWCWAPRGSAVGHLEPLGDELRGDRPDRRLWREPRGDRDNLLQVGLDEAGTFAASRWSSDADVYFRLVVERSKERTVVLAVTRRSWGEDLLTHVEVLETDARGLPRRYFDLRPPHALARHVRCSYELDESGRVAVVRREVEDRDDPVEAWQFDVEYSGATSAPRRITGSALDALGRPVGRRRLVFLPVAPSELKVATATVVERLPVLIETWAASALMTLGPLGSVALVYDAQNPALPPSLGATPMSAATSRGLARTTLPAELTLFDPLPSVFDEPAFQDAGEVLSLRWQRSANAAPIRRLLTAAAAQVTRAARLDPMPFVYVADVQLDAVDQDLGRLDAALG